MDGYENKIENGLTVNDNDKMIYYGAKAWVGEKLDTSEQNAANQSFGNVLHDDILDTYKSSDAKSVNNDIKLLAGLDSGLAGDVNSTFAGIRETERNQKLIQENQYLADFKELDRSKTDEYIKTNPSALNGGGDKIYYAAGYGGGTLAACGIGSLGGETQLILMVEVSQVNVFGKTIPCPTDSILGIYNVDKSGMGVPDTNDHTDDEKYGITNGARDNNLRIGNPQQAIGVSAGVTFITGSGHFDNFDKAKEGITGYFNETYSSAAFTPFSVGHAESPSLKTSDTGWKLDNVGVGVGYIAGQGQSYTTKVLDDSEVTNYIVKSLSE